MSHHEQQINKQKGKQSPVAMTLSSHNSKINKARELFKPSDDAQSPILKNWEDLELILLWVSSY